MARPTFPVRMRQFQKRYHRNADAPNANFSEFESDISFGNPSSDSYQNHVYFYSEITTQSVLSLIKQLRDADHWLQSDRIAFSLGSYTLPEIPIFLHISSTGGDLMAAFGAVDIIKSIKTPIYSVVEGYAASAATLIATACTKRFITKHSYLLIHQLQAEVSGTYEQFKDEIKLQEDLMKKLVDFYVEHSSLDHASISERLSRDYWLNAEEALASGFVEEIV